jgi:hypothetical protein
MQNPAKPRLPKLLLALLLTTTFLKSFPAAAADRTDIAISALEFGGSVGKLLWVGVTDQSNIPTPEASEYIKLAQKVKAQIDIGRAGSSLIAANFDLIGTTLAYSAVVDPEPLSKAVAGIAAYGAKKTGDALSHMVIEQSQNQAHSILAEGFKKSEFTVAQLQNMSAPELRAKVAELKIGDQTLGQILKDDPGSLNMLQAHAVDIATTLGTTALVTAKEAVIDIENVRQQLRKTKEDIDKYQSEVSNHLQKIDDRMSRLHDATVAANEKLKALKTEVQGNTKAIQTLAEVSYSGWSTAQKLQAVQSGLFPGLSDVQRSALIGSLTADKRREDAIAAIGTAARDFGSLATIASNIGLPKDVVTGMQGAQTVASGITQFATGNYLGALASLTSLVGLGAPDAGAQRHAQMMQYLQQQFALINEKLDKIIDLQVQTLKAIAVLADEQRQFRRDVLGQLDRIEDAVLRSEQILQAILLSQWTECHSLINGPPLNGQYTIPSRRVLVNVIGSANARSYAEACYRRMVAYLDAWVKPASWSGTIISATNFPSDSIAADTALAKRWSAFQFQRTRAYATARDFLLEALPKASSEPAAYLARLAQPVVDANYSEQLEAIFGKPEIAKQFSSFKCNEMGVLSPPLRELLCFGLVEGSSSPPLGDRWAGMLNAALIGPHSMRIIDTAITLAAITDFARRDRAGALEFVQPELIESFSRDGLTTDIREALNQRKGLELLTKLQWLTEATVLQQSITYGDLTAKLVEKAIYDVGSKSINADPKVMTSLKQKAIAAMRANPILARNVVLLGMRHAIAATLGDKAEGVRFNQTYYGLALDDFTGSQACDGAVLPRQKLNELFPNWKFEYWVTAAQKQDTAFAKCPLELQPDPDSSAPQLPAPGSGVGVAVADFYVLLPSPPKLAAGVYEQSNSLRLALVYRDRLSQAIIDRGVGEILTAAGQPRDIATATGFALLNEGWGWQSRAKSK